MEIYRGVWADRLENEQELPIGGSIFSDDLTTKLTLDFDTFDEQLDRWHSPQKMSEVYERNRQKITDWLTQVGSKVDPYLFFVAQEVQRKVHALMDFKPESVPSDNLEKRLRERKAKLFKDEKVKLTDLKGIAACAEQAALGQYLLQNVLEEGYSSSYMGGVVAKSPGEESNHSFIVLKGPDSKTYIFDIARPRSVNNLPRVLETDVPFDYGLFAGTENLLVGSTEVLQGGRLYFGVGHPMLEYERQVIDAQQQ